MFKCPKCSKEFKKEHGLALHNKLIHTWSGQRMLKQRSKKVRLNKLDVLAVKATPALPDLSSIETDESLAFLSKSLSLLVMAKQISMMPAKEASRMALMVQHASR